MNTYTVKPGTMADFINELNTSGVEEMYRALPGRIKFDFSTAINDENTFYLNDLWEDEEAFENHRRSEASSIFKAIKEKYVIKSDLQRFDF